MLRCDKVTAGGYTFWALYHDGAYVKSFASSWLASNYTLLKWGILPEFHS